MAENAADPHRGCEPGQPQLLQLRPDRRLGHEWDDWNGEPLPNGGVFEGRPRLFFLLTASWMAAIAAIAAVTIWIATPRLGQLWQPAPLLLWLSLAAAVTAAAVWLAGIGFALRSRTNPLPAWWAEGGLLPLVMPMAERTGRWFGIARDRSGNAAIRVYNTLAAARTRPGVTPGELLVLLPRCLDKDSMQGAMAISARYGVPLFVAARGRYAREMIARTRPRAIVAVACERDLVSGIHDVAPKLPVLGTTLALPDGPCKNTGADLASMERQIREFLGLDLGRAAASADAENPFPDDRERGARLASSAGA